MPQNRPCDVSPSSPQDKYSLALQDEAGRWYGLDVLLSQIRPSTVNAPRALDRVGLNSFHAGRGFDKFVPNQYGYYDGHNLWSTTPGKAHATPLFRWARGIRSSDFNMPNVYGVNWQPLLGATRYLDVSFVASASYTAGKFTLLIRRRVPAETVGTPGQITAEICSNSAGNPSTVLSTMTAVSIDIPDVFSEYYTWNISLALTSGTTYHIKVYGAAADRDQSHWEVAVDTSVAGKKSTAGSSWSATTYSPYYFLTDVPATNHQIKMFTWNGALYALKMYDNKITASQLYINGVRGRATSGSTTTLVDTGHGSYGATVLPTNRFAGCFLRCIRGTGQGQAVEITSNDGTSFSFAAVDTAFDATSEYIVYGSEWFVEIGSTGLGAVTGLPAISNDIVYFPQGDSVNIRIMHLDYTDADDHAWDVENTNNNKAYFLTTGFDDAEGPQLWRANNILSASTPNNGAAISVSRAPTAPLAGSPLIPTPLTFGTDATFKTAILAGENTNRITNIYFHDRALYVFKENTVYIVQNDRAINAKIGGESASDIHNGLAACVAAKQMYFSFADDVYLLAGGSCYPTNLQTNLPSSRSGFVSALEARKGWIFAALDAGTGVSSVMKYSLDRQTWSEQLRGYSAGRRIRNLQWQDCPESRPRLWVDIGNDLVYQEFPLNGVRPYDDSGMKYQHEAEIVLPTVDLQNVDSKYFSILTITSQGLANEDDTEVGHEIIVEYQVDNEIGQVKWRHAGYIRTSPSGSVEINKGNTRMLRPRLRLLSNEATDPVIVEAVGLSLFSRHQLSEQWQIGFKLDDSDEEQNSVEVLKWLRSVAQTAEPLRMLSSFPLYHNRKVTISNMPYYNLEEFNPESDELEALLQMQLTEVT